MRWLVSLFVLWIALNAWGLWYGMKIAGWK